MYSLQSMYMLHLLPLLVSPDYISSLDISLTSIHITRRIWNETLTTVLLTNPDTRMPASQKIIYAEGPSGQWPPYLLGFGGSVSERHVENLKVCLEFELFSF